MRAPERSRVLLLGGILALASVAAYWRSFTVPFFFDDTSAVSENPTIRNLWSLGEVLNPPHTGGGVTGRPVVNLTLAVNYALGGLDVRGYHVANLAIHLAAGLVLFGLTRRTLLWPVIPQRVRELARPAGFFTALLWLVHPLQTETVVGVVQRTESLVGLFYLLTLYCFVRGAETPSRAAGWRALAVLACWLGMATKEVMVTAPLMALLYDRTFISGTFRDAWRRNRRIHIGLAGGWLVLACLLANVGGSRGTSAGFGLGVTPWTYALTQCRAIVIYLRLAFWPHPLIVDYGTGVVASLGQVLPQALLVVALVAAGGFALCRRPVAGFLAAWFFVILAPSSSVVPLVTQTIAEHRMYLPLAGLVAASVAGAAACLGRRGLVPGVLVALLFAGLTARRTADYRSELALWTDTVAKRPDNGRAHLNLGSALKAAGRYREAAAEFEDAARLTPDRPDPFSNLAAAWIDLGRPDVAIAQARTAIRLDPAFAPAHDHLATAFAQTGRLEEAIGEYGIALSLRPGVAETESNLAAALVKSGRWEAAIEHATAALRIDPGLGRAHYNLGSALLQGRRLAGAIEQFRSGLRSDPGDAKMHYNLGIALLQSGMNAEALPEFSAAVRIDPGFADAHYGFAIALYQAGRVDEAERECGEALRIRPDFPAARRDLERLRALRPSG